MRLWEEEGTYTWATGEDDEHKSHGLCQLWRGICPSEHNPDVQRMLLLLQAEKDRNASYWEAWLQVRAEFGTETASALLMAATLDVVARHPTGYLDRTWFRLQRMWRGGFAKERVHDLYDQQELLNIHSPIFAVHDEFPDIAELAGNRVDRITRIFRPDMLPAFLTLALTVACAVSAIVYRRLRPALVPLGMGLGLLLVVVLLNADRARYYHSAEPILLLTYAAGLWGIALALHSGWAASACTTRSCQQQDSQDTRLSNQQALKGCPCAHPSIHDRCFTTVPLASALRYVRTPP